MRRLAVLLLFACSAAADSFGPLIIEPRAAVGPMRDGAYYEYRFNVVNPTADAHVVRIDLAGSILGGGAQPRASRTIVAAPRASTMVSIPQYVMNQYGLREAVVSVDGVEQETRLAVGAYASPGGSYRTTLDVLIGRTVDAGVPLAIAPDSSGVEAIRPSISPASWSANWIHYSVFSGAIFTTRDWLERPRPVQAALLRWVAAGGSITFIGDVPDGLPEMRGSGAQLGFDARHLGLGCVNLLPESETIAPHVGALRSTWREVDIDTRYQWYGEQQQDTPIPLLDDASLPVKSLFSLLVVFAVVGGPLNLWVLAKKQRRLWIFWTLPLLAAVTAAILVGSVIASEGWVRIQKTASLTLLDERAGEAATIGWTGFYATLAPDGEVRFESGTEVRPLFASSEGHTDWSDGQRFVSGWIGSRLARGFALRKVEPRRERLPLRREQDQLIAVNGLGTHIGSLWVADDVGRIYTAKDVAAGKEVVLTPTGTLANATVADPAYLAAAPSTWASYPTRFTQQPMSVLQPGMYLASVERSPFVEAALARPTKSVSTAVVIGVIKRIGDAR